jgi:hypothetical protein
MSSYSKGCIGALSVAVLLGLAGLARADEPNYENPQSLSLDPTVVSVAADPNASTSTDSTDTSNLPQATFREGQSTTQFLDDEPEKPNVHGFFGAEFNTAYVTPRGLVVQNEGLVIQPIIGLVLPIGDIGPLKGFTLAGGIWNDIDFAEAGDGNHTTGGWDECDPFFSMSWTAASKLSMNLTYVVFVSPQHAYAAEHNLDLKTTFDDSDTPWGKYLALKPYVDLWCAISGGSTVVLGNTGGSGYVELGVGPSYTFKPNPSYPITLTVPIYTSVGPRTYWAKSGLPGGNFGLFSTALKASMPLSFVPGRYGGWHINAGVTYDYLINTSLRDAGEIVSGNTNRNVLVGSLGFGLSF